MKVKKIFCALMATAALMFFAGCGRSDEQISTDVKPVVEKIIANAGVKGECTRVIDIQKKDSDHYTATAEVKYKKTVYGLDVTETELLDISIAYDGDTVLVKIGK